MPTKKFQDILPRMTREEAIPLIKKQIQKLDEITKLTFNDPKVDAWESYTRNLLDGFYGKPNGEMHQNTYEIIHADQGPLWVGMSHPQLQENHVRQQKNRKALLEGQLEQLEDLHATTTPKKEPTTEGMNMAESCVFLVHGRNDGIKSEVARLIEKLSLPVIILHEQPNEGQTIVEKFEKHAARSNFAVVLLTADDQGGLKDSPTFSLRARQNVVLELGYFMGKFTRKNVCALYENGVELPSDYAGILYIPFDSNGAWKLQLAKEMKTAGLPVDITKV